MAILGLLIVLAAAAFGTEVVLSNTTSTTGEAFGQTLADVSLGGFFLAGAATALALCLGLALVLSGLGRARRTRGQRKVAAKRERERVEAVASERDEAAAEASRLRDELMRERMEAATLGGVAVPPGLDDATYDEDDDDSTIDLRESAERDTSRGRHRARTNEQVAVGDRTRSTKSGVLSRLGFTESDEHRGDRGTV